MKCTINLEMIFIPIRNPTQLCWERVAGNLFESCGSSRDHDANEKGKWKSTLTTRELDRLLLLHSEKGLVPSAVTEK